MTEDLDKKVNSGKEQMGTEDISYLPVSDRGGIDGRSLPAVTDYRTLSHPLTCQLNPMCQYRGCWLKNPYVFCPYLREVINDK
jgi:hypothetical protein